MSGLLETGVADAAWREVWKRIDYVRLAMSLSLVDVARLCGRRTLPKIHQRVSPRPVPIELLVGACNGMGLRADYLLGLMGEPDEIEDLASVFVSGYARPPKVMRVRLEKRADSRFPWMPDYERRRLDLEIKERRRLRRRSPLVPSGPLPKEPGRFSSAGQFYGDEPTPEEWRRVLMRAFQRRRLARGLVIDSERPAEEEPG